MKFGGSFVVDYQAFERGADIVTAMALAVTLMSVIKPSLPPILWDSRLSSQKSLPFRYSEMALLIGLIWPHP